MKHRLGPASREFLAAEFLLVILIAFGLFSAAGLWSLLSPGADRVARVFGEDPRWNVALYQLAVAPVIAYILFERRWKWAEFAVRISPRGVLQGVGLAASAYLLAWAVTLLVSPLASASAGVAVAGAVAARATFGTVLLTTLVNPLFEELLVCGYVIQTLRGRFGIATAVNVSIALRMSCHLYQGPTAFLGFAAFGLLFTLFYVRTGRLWPLIVAHAILEAFQLSG